jgi:hypothetical protein
MRRSFASFRDLAHASAVAALGPQRNLVRQATDACLVLAGQKRHRRGDEHLMHRAFSRWSTARDRL